MWEKRATSAECKTIRIAESSVMDSWKALLRPICKVLCFKNGVETVLQLYQRVGMSLPEMSDHEGLWSERRSFRGNKHGGDFLEEKF